MRFIHDNFETATGRRQTVYDLDVFAIRANQHYESDTWWSLHQGRWNVIPWDRIFSFSF
jgi:hypothetical protein